MKILVTVFAAALFASPALAGEAVRPMSEMRGDCANYKTDLSREFSAWKEKAVALQASDCPACAVDHRVTLNQRTALTLLKPSAVNFPVAPEQKRDREDAHAGMVTVAFKAPGRYRISASTGVWIDLVNDASLVPSLAFEMQTQCKPIFKSIVWEVAEPGLYHIQLSGNPGDTVEVLVSTVTP
jgi:hypothetical protein